MRVRIYLKSGQMIKLRGVQEMSFVPGERLSWKSRGRWLPLDIRPSEIAAITEHKKWWP